MNLGRTQQRIRLVTLAVLVGSALILTILDSTGTLNGVIGFVRDPLTETTYRDTAVEPGATYTYAVIALDLLGNPSEQSERQIVTVR